MRSTTWLNNWRYFLGTCLRKKEIRNFTAGILKSQSYLRYSQTSIFKGMIHRGVFFGLFIVGCWMVQAQIAEEIPTNSTVRKRVDHRKYEPKEKSYSRLYKKSTKGILYGNPCALEMTRQMGFEYVPLAQGRGKTRVGLILNNFAVKSKLCVTRTPFWKSILNKRLKDCRLKTGDFVG